jgi:hypothetical protein
VLLQLLFLLLQSIMLFLACAKARNESDWDPFLRRYSHMWRGFVEHWLLAERCVGVGTCGPRVAFLSLCFNDAVRSLCALSGPLWEVRSLPLDPRLMEEGPREVASADGRPRQRYFVVRSESLVKDPAQVALQVLRWAQGAIVPDGLATTPSRLLERAEVRAKCPVVPSWASHGPLSLQ